MFWSVSTTYQSRLSFCRRVFVSWCFLCWLNLMVMLLQRGTSRFSTSGRLTTTVDSAPANWLVRFWSLNTWRQQSIHSLSIAVYESWCFPRRHKQIQYLSIESSCFDQWSAISPSISINRVSRAGDNDWVSSLIIVSKSLPLTMCWRDEGRPTLRAATTTW